MEARLRAFADQLRGAFCDLSNGEEAFLRLKDRAGLTEGAAIRVKVQSEARGEKLARVGLTDDPLIERPAFDLWRAMIGAPDDVELVEDRETVAAAFEDAVAPSVVLPGGGTLHIARTRALTAIDVDTAGRLDKGSAGARALAINRDAVTELARQVALRGLGGALVLDCVSPINADAADKIRAAGRAAFATYGLPQAQVFKPSPLGLLQASVAWQVRPIAEVQRDDPNETQLLEHLRDAQREAEARPSVFFELSLSEPIWRAYQARKAETDQALAETFSGRITVVKSTTEKSEIRRV